MHRKTDRLWFSPTDLAGHVACPHLTHLDLQSLDSDLVPSFRANPTLDLLIELGQIHEQNYLDQLKSMGKTCAELNGQNDPGTLLETMAAGVDVIYQAALELAPWNGKADFLIKVKAPSNFGEWSYEVADTKLSQDTKATSIMQLCVYSEILSALQGVEPSFLHIVKPGEPFDIESFRLHDFGAYYRMAKARFLHFTQRTPRPASYPQPCSQCEVCKWSIECENQLRKDDHLGFVAGIRKSQIVELKEVGIDRLESYAKSESAHPSRPRRGSLEALATVHKQAKIQWKGRASGKPELELENFQEGRGFCLLPEPDPGDIFFDIEGNPRAISNGIEYLLGYVELGSNPPAYTALWALDKAEEKTNFVKLMQYLIERIQRYPDMFIYHYAPYEPTTLKRLALEHAVYEEELDDILRCERFVDLHAVVRQSLRASVESYSIKQMEPFYGFNRMEPLDQARSSLSFVERMIELGIANKLAIETKDSVQRYNEDDCRSTLAMRDWLEQLRAECGKERETIPRRIVKPLETKAESAQIAADTKRVFDGLLEGLESKPEDELGQARWLLAHTLEYFRREQKVKWWEFFRLRDLTPEELFVERSAIAGLTHQMQLPLVGKARIPTHRYAFPDQEVAVKVGDDLWNSQGERIGSIEAIDLDKNYVDVKKTKNTLDARPTELFAFTHIGPGTMPQALLALGEALVTATPSQKIPKSACFDLLARQKPRLNTLKLPIDGEMHEVAIRVAKDLDRSVLAIQGPPGAGKTHVGSKMIEALAQEGFRIGVTAVGHKVILNLLEGVVEKSNGQIKVAHQMSEPGDDFPNTIKLSKNKSDSLALLTSGHVVGGTAWLWSDPAMQQQLDYLFIDEAGQMSLAMALAAGKSAKNIILLGDPQQLNQPQQGEHPHESGVAALSHILGEQATISPEAGLFLEDTWRLHPDICRFTSEQYYDGRLKSRAGLEQQRVLGSDGSECFGLRFVSLLHTGNENRSSEEVEKVKQLFEEFLTGAFIWTDRTGENLPLRLEDILVVAPYNSQVAALQTALPTGARIGTVDKFQGQEAPIVIYSMTSSSIDDAPRGVTFLFDRNRMNVATSRAKCLAIVVGSPTLLAPPCASPPQLMMANGLCRLSEFSCDGN